MSRKVTENKKSDTMEKIVSLCKRRGFVYPGSEIYGGLAGTWDYGPLGLKLKRNVMNLWLQRFVDSRTDIYDVDSALLMRQEVWQASGHVAGFSDLVVECSKCKRQFRADQLPSPRFNLGDSKKVQPLSPPCPECGGKLGSERKFNMMFETNVGVTVDEGSVSYLRPETAQGMFVNFKNIIDSFHPDFPFGLAQIGKAFRNEIAPRDFLFRAREFELMEIEYFVRPDDWENAFENFRKEIHAWTEDIGLRADRVHELEVPDGERAHYSKRTIDFEFDYPFGRKELYGLAYRTDFDLKSHIEKSGVDLSYLDEEGKNRFVPHVIEPSFGVDRTVLAILTDAYTEDVLGNEPRVYLRLHKNVAPVKTAVFSLLKNKPALIAKAREVYEMLRQNIPQIMFDDNGNIGKRYRRQDEIGTPHCITIDFQTLEDETVTLRDRDTGKQTRVKIPDLMNLVK